jgi:hypothetical protein
LGKVGEKAVKNAAKQESQTSPLGGLPRPAARIELIVKEEKKVRYIL